MGITRQSVRANPSIGGLSDERRVFCLGLTRFCVREGALQTGRLRFAPKFDLSGKGFYSIRCYTGKS